MLIKTYTYPITNKNFSDNPYIFMDIETTGFARDTTILYLIGCGFFEENQFHIIQWFNDDGVSEPVILAAFQDFLEEKKRRLFTFNGDNFDIPYLNRHFILNDIPYQIDASQQFDIYKVLKPFQTLFSLPHGRQKDWEHFLGVKREDVYNGGELIGIYKQYLRKKENSLLDSLLLHNMEDIRGMEMLLPLSAYGSLMEGDFSFQSVRPATTQEFLPLDGAGVAVSCSLNKALPRPLEIPSLYLESEHISGALRASGHQMDLFFPVEEGPLKYFYPDYKNYFYLPGEDRAVHKTVGYFVDSSFREKARPCTCYAKKDGLFLPVLFHKKYKGIQTNAAQYKNVFTFYKREYKDKHSYIEFQELFQDKKEYLPIYLSDWMKEIFIAKMRQTAKK